MWKNKFQSMNKVRNWRGGGNRYGTSRRPGDRPFNRRQSPDRNRSSLNSDRDTRRLDDYKNTRHLNDGGRDSFGGNRPFDDRDARPLNSAYVDRFDKDMSFSNNYEKDDFRRDDFDRYNPDILNRGLNSEHQEQLFDGRNDFDRLDHGLTFSGRNLDNSELRRDNFDSRIDLEYKVPLYDDSLLPQVLESDKWNRDKPRQPLDDYEGRHSEYDNSSLARQGHVNVRDTKYGDDRKDMMKTERKSDRRHSPVERFQTSPHQTGGNLDSYRSFDKKFSGDRSERGNTKKETVPLRREKHTNVHDDKFHKSVKGDKSRHSDRSDKRYGSSIRKDSKSDCRSNTVHGKESRYSKSSEDFKESTGKQRETGSSSVRRNDDKTLDHKDNQNERHRDSGVKHSGSRSRSGSRDSNKKSVSNQDKHDSKSHRSGKSFDEIDKFKKPSSASIPRHNSSNRTGSGRHAETDVGQYNEDDILSIMADDDGFDCDRKFGNNNISSAHISVGKSRDSIDLDRHDFHGSHVEEEFGGIEKPLLEIHAESSAQNFGDHSETRERKRSDDRSGINKPSATSRNFSRRGRVGIYGRDNGRSGFKAVARTNTNRYMGKASNWNSKVKNVSSLKSNYKNVREEFGKTGAVLREDRGDQTNSAVRTQNIGKTGAVLREDRFDNDYKTKTGVRNPDFQRKSRNFGFGAGKQNSFFKSRVGLRSNFHSHRVKQKYLRGGFRGLRHESYSSKLKNDKHKSMDREVRKNRSDDRNNESGNRRADDNNDFEDVRIGDDVNESDFQDFPLNAEQQVESNQHIVFIPNQEVSTGLAPMVDPLRRVIYNPNLGDEDQIPVQYIPDQFATDPAGVGEQMVFIPFVNQMSNYPENYPNLYDSSTKVNVDDKQTTQKGSKRSKAKPLSNSAKAMIRRKLEAKKKKRMEEEIERKVLKKLFGKTRIAEAVHGEEIPQAKKKPIIKRISPPTGNKPTHLHKPLKLVSKPSQPDVVEISDEEDADRYDSVSDLEDVSEEEDYENKKDKRPVFRKPGQPRRSASNRKNENRSDDTNEDDHTFHDVRRVVQSSRNRGNTVGDSAPGQKRQRSSYEEASTSYKQSANKSDRLGIKKSRRSISPIEITVSNDCFSKTSSNRQRGREDNKDDPRNRSQFAEENALRHPHGIENKKYGIEASHMKRSTSPHEKRSLGSRNREEIRGHTSGSNTEASKVTSEWNSYGYGKYSRDDSWARNRGRGRSSLSKYRNIDDSDHGLDGHSDWDNGDADSNRFGPKGRHIEDTVMVREYGHGHFTSQKADESPIRASPSQYNDNAFNSPYPTKHSFSEQSAAGHSFNISTMPPQFSKPGPSIDPSLPPVPLSSLPIPSFPPSNLLRPDMSLPPAVSAMGNSPNRFTVSNPGNFQQNYGVQSFQSLPQQQMHVIQQNQSQMQLQQPLLNSGSQIGIQPNQLQQMQQNVGIVPINQNVMSDNIGQALTTQVPHGNYQQVNQSAYITANAQGVRGVVGTLKTNVTNQPVGLRVAQVESGSQGHSGMVARSVGRTDVKHSPKLSLLPVDDDAYFDDLVQMVCSKCNCVLLDHSMMKAHGKWHDMIEANNDRWRCDQCEQGYQVLTAYNDHMSLRHTYNSWNCSLCIMSFSSSSGLNKHIRHSSHKNMKVKFVCSLCPASFMVLTQLVQHKKEVHQSNHGYTGYRKF